MMAGTTDSDLVSTGIDVLDDRLGGGFPAGSVVALRAPAGSAGEYVAYSLATAPARRTSYLTTVRPADVVKADLERYRETARGTTVTGGTREPESQPDNLLTVTRVPFRVDSPTSREPNQSMGPMEACLADAMTVFDSTDAACAGVTGESVQPPVLVIDAFSTIMDRTEPELWRRLLDTISETVATRGGLACLVVHTTSNATTPNLDHVLHAADAVVTYELGDGEQSDRLRITKLRAPSDGVAALPFILPLLVENRIKRDPDERA